MSFFLDKVWGGAGDRKNELVFFFRAVRSTYGLSWVSTSVHSQSLSASGATYCGSLRPQRSGLNLRGDEHGVKIKIKCWSFFCLLAAWLLPILVIDKTTTHRRDKMVLGIIGGSSLLASQYFEGFDERSMPRSGWRRRPFSRDPIFFF